MVGAGISTTRNRILLLACGRSSRRQISFDSDMVGSLRRKISTWFISRGHRAMQLIWPIHQELLGRTSSHFIQVLSGLRKLFGEIYLIHSSRGLVVWRMSRAAISQGSMGV